MTRPARALRCPRGALFRTSSCNPRAVRGRRSCRIACRMFRRSTLERARSFHRPGRARAHPRHAKDGSSKVRERGWQPGSRLTVWAKVARQVSRGRGVIEVCPLPCLAKAVPPQCTCDGGCPTIRRRGLQKCSTCRTAVAVAPLAPPRSVPGAILVTTYQVRTVQQHITQSLGIPH